jgi:hypothetical protein
MADSEICGTKDPTCHLILLDTRFELPLGAGVGCAVQSLWSWAQPAVTCQRGRLSPTGSGLGLPAGPCRDRGCDAGGGQRQDRQMTETDER